MVLATQNFTMDNSTNELRACIIIELAKLATFSMELGHLLHELGHLLHELEAFLCGIRST